jgi:hypothetical protein
MISRVLWTRFFCEEAACRRLRWQMTRSERCLTAGSELAANFPFRDSSQCAGISQRKPLLVERLKPRMYPDVLLHAGIFRMQVTVPSKCKIQGEDFCSGMSVEQRLDTKQPKYGSAEIDAYKESQSNDDAHGENVQ